MFSKPLFKQSIKANFTRWIIVTFASCFIVAVVILILGNLNVNKIRGSLEDLFEDSDKQADIQYKSADSYQKTYDVYTKTLRTKTRANFELRRKAIAGETQLIEIDTAKTNGTTGHYLAVKYDVLITINEWLGEDATISYDINYSNPKTGYATISGDTITFVEDADVSL